MHNPLRAGGGKSVSSGSKKKDRGKKKVKSRVTEPWGDACEASEGYPTNRSDVHNHRQQLRDLAEVGEEGEGEETEASKTESTR